MSGNKTVHQAIRYANYIFLRLSILIGSLKEADFNSSISNKLVCSMETACSVFKLPIPSSHTQDLFYQEENKGDWELSILSY